MDPVSARFQHTNLGAPTPIGHSSIEYIVSTQRGDKATFVLEARFSIACWVKGLGDWYGVSLRLKRHGGSQ